MLRRLSLTNDRRLVSGTQGVWPSVLASAFHLAAHSAPSNYSLKLKMIYMCPPSTELLSIETRSYCLPFRQTCQPRARVPTSRLLFVCTSSGGSQGTNAWRAILIRWTHLSIPQTKFSARQHSVCLQLGLRPSLTDNLFTKSCRLVNIFSGPGRREETSG
jgi:hypothetical protein